MEYSYRYRQDLNSYIMLLVLFGLMVVGLYLSAVAAKFTLGPFFGIADGTGFMAIPEEQLRHPMALLYVQALTSSIGFFLLPTVFYHIIFGYDMREAMGLVHMPPVRFWLTAIGTMAMAVIFIQLLVQICSAIPLTGQYASLRSVQDIADRMIDSLFTETGVLRFLVLTLVLAILPAVAEEFCFRGTIQPLLARTNLGPLGAIVMTGLTFSLVHFEFNNFLAIWCMGMVLGFLFYYTGSIWVSVSAHFLNNFLVVGGKYAYALHLLHTDVAGNDTLPLYMTLPAGVAMVYGLFVLRKWSGKNVEGFHN